MKKLLIIIGIFTGIVLSFRFPLQGKVRIVSTYKYIGDIAQQVGGELVTVTALAKGTRDPHFITPKPSFIAKLRKADLLIINGGQLEVGWLPPVMRQANNPKINSGSDGFLSLIDFITPIDVNENVSRAQGDVHPEGNPHIQLNPDNIPVFATAIADKLSRLDPENREKYRENCDSFKSKWQQKMIEWNRALEKLKGVKVVEYHKVYDYLFHRYEIKLMGTLEPLPGIPPTTKHITALIDMMKKQQVKYVLQDVYHSSKTARFVAEKTGAQLVVVPHDVGSVEEAGDIFALFDSLVRRLTLK